MRDLKFLTAETKRGKVVPGRSVSLLGDDKLLVGGFGPFSVASPILPIWMLGNVFPHFNRIYFVKGIPCAGGG